MGGIKVVYMQPFFWAIRVLVFFGVLGAFAQILGTPARRLWPFLPTWLPWGFFVGGVLLANLVYWLGWRSEEERIWGRYRRR
jgi:hypothetical protein